MSSLAGGTGIIGQDMVCGLNGKYKTFEGTEISIENCLKAKVKDLRVEGKTMQDTEDLSNIESVAEREENLVNTATIYESMLENGLEGSLFNPKSNSAYDVYKMEIQPNTEYVFNLVGYGQTPWIRILDKDNIILRSYALAAIGSYIWSLKTESNSYYLVFNKTKTATGEFKIYKEQNPYPLKLKINEENNYINLPIPLRSLPSGVADTIEGNKLVQRVGKVVIDENIVVSSFTSRTNTLRVGLMVGAKQNVVESTIVTLSDKLQYSNSVYAKDIEGMYVSVSGVLYLSLKIDKYGNTLNEFLIKIKENPITIYYELATPIIHDLEIPSISTVRGTNIITTENNIKPKLSMKVKVKK